MSEKLVEYITQEEFEKLLEYNIEQESQASKNKSPTIKLRKMRVAMLLGFEAGLRISEIVGLKEEVSKCCHAHIGGKKENYKNQYFCEKCNNQIPRKFTTRGGQQIIKPLTKEQIEEGNKIRIIDGKGKKDRIAPLPKRFTEKSFNLLPLDISRRSIQLYIKQIGKEVLKKDIHFHHLRHGFGSHLISKKVGLPEIMLLMGHSKMETTAKYLHANPIEAISKAREAF